VTYKLNRHQHIPEIVQELQLFSKKLHHIQFSTSLLPVNRGIMATSYVKLKKPLSEAEIIRHLQGCLQGQTFCSHPR